eukprot:COSAG02_NODE_10136_length_2013_cov_1.990073_4_plen_90_part_00
MVCVYVCAGGVAGTHGSARARVYYAVDQTNATHVEEGRQIFSTREAYREQPLASVRAAWRASKPSAADQFRRPAPAAALQSGACAQATG